MPRKKQPSENCFKCKVKLTDTNRQNGKNLRCKSCYNAYMREYFQTSKDKHNEIMKKWRAKNKELVHQMNVNLAIKKFGSYHASLMFYASKGKDALTDNYVKSLLVNRYNNLQRTDIPDDLIQLKRKQVLLTREIKKQNYA